MILMIDNYDSFVYNLVHYFEELDEEIIVKRNDEITIDDIKILNPEIIVLSPGPCSPNEAGICIETVKYFKGIIPILGIFDSKIVKAIEPVHGKVHSITHDNKGVFTNLKNPLNVTRYHSLVVERETLPDKLEISAETKEGEIMGLRHKDYMIEGVQFHPEAVLTEYGHELLQNFITLAREKSSNLKEREKQDA